MYRINMSSLLYLFAILSIPSLVMAQPFGIRVPTEPVWEQAPARAAVSKVKSEAKKITKVKKPIYYKPSTRYLPFTFWTGGYQPAPARGQALISARVAYAQVRGTARRMLPALPLLPTHDKPVELQRDLGLEGHHPIFTVTAQYQFLPAWGIRYSFTPMDISQTSKLDRTFTYRGRTFMSGSEVSTRWERSDHRAGLVFSLVRKPGSLVSLYGDWLHSEVTLSVRATQITSAMGAARYDDDRDLAVLGLELDKSLTSFRGSAIGLRCKAGVAFLDNHLGYEAEAAMTYSLRIGARSYGFLRGGYRYAQIKKDENSIMSSTTLNGAFVEIAFLL
ncbi:hypothetical protein ACFL2Q_13885 [Thermodesulfobacteriota bacterium]